ncbi:hypothetical protein IE81DRAFT_127564 [Ceraceosorus guamensis]|uniref:Uncharacterized protein n=1 Tax=Ceraceosorus guamensis TaxID=1522189 RepID=A0A316W8F2_9BASI|nr:hypothetical protein IE81DRAFT_127564 [Ceraceosorus guamensis]PWN45834.1 hypothetical protein IE81DRAFT_127564 [Ceraceosorus guamensis]
MTARHLLPFHQDFHSKPSRPSYDILCPLHPTSHILSLPFVLLSILKFHTMRMVKVRLSKNALDPNLHWPARAAVVALESRRLNLESWGALRCTPVRSVGVVAPRPSCNDASCVCLVAIRNRDAIDQGSAKIRALASEAAYTQLPFKTRP